MGAIALHAALSGPMGNGHNTGTIAAVITHSDINIDVDVDVGKQQRWKITTTIATAWCAGKCTW